MVRGTPARELEPGALAPALEARESTLRTDHARLLRRDPTLWRRAGSSAGDWLGWLDSLERAPAHLRTILPIARALTEQGVAQVVLVGMGGSSLFPMVLAGACGAAEGEVELLVLDSTDPAAVARVERSVDWSRAALVVASKSGTTVETLAHLDRMLVLLEDGCGAAAARRTVVVTDPGSPLEAFASSGRAVLVNGDPDVGGRYSALSPFGLLPAALLGLDVEAMLMRVRADAQRWSEDPWAEGGPAAIAALLACAVAAGRDALHLVVDHRATLLGAWIEQLVAESSGKDGTGVLPVVVGSCSDVVVRDRAVVVAVGETEGLDALISDGVPVLRLPRPDCLALGSEVLRWMQAVPLLCAQLGVDPFDQPDVAAAKAATADALERGTEPEPEATLASLPGLEGRGYVALLAYVDPEGEDARRLPDIARRLSEASMTPVTVGLGPRYLHSTGQLHKGGRNDATYLILVGEDPDDVPIPGRSYGFSRLKRAQAAGDLSALRAAGRRAHRIGFDDPGLTG